MVAAKNRAASAKPPIDDLPLFHRRYHAHNPDAGTNERREELVRAATPQRSPNAIHSLTPSRSSRVSASHKISDSSSAARLVSQTQRDPQYITVGNSAHAQLAQTATFSPKHFRAIRKIGTQVRAEKMLLMMSRISAEVRV